MMQNLINKMLRLRLAYAEPSEYFEVIHVPEKTAWAEALEEELAGHGKNNTLRIVDGPTKGVPLTARRVFKGRPTPARNIERLKARLVARCFLDMLGHDYFETYAPLAKPQSIGSLLVLAARNNLALMQFDERTAFLHGTISETVYMDHPDGPPDRRLLIDKALYGLKQEAGAWNSGFNWALKEIGTLSEPCVYLHMSMGSTYGAIHVEDGITVSAEKAIKGTLIAELEKKLTTKLVNGTTFLGLEITRKEAGLEINQTRNIEDIKNISIGVTPPPHQRLSLHRRGPESSCFAL